jgi:hypothetical protein
MCLYGLWVYYIVWGFSDSFDFSLRSMDGQKIDENSAAINISDVSKYLNKYYNYLELYFNTWIFKII